jgi:uncharacterized membrane protein
MTSNRSRVNRGVPTGGQFKTEHKKSKAGFETESRGWWALDVTGVNPDETTLEYIADLSRGGSTSGEIVQDGAQSRGWWELEVTDVDLDESTLAHIADLISSGVTSGEVNSDA